MWQANTVRRKLEANGYACELVPIESTGDIQLTQPIYALGISGVFTKQLDTALLNNQADIAVHSLKDVPTQLAENLFLVATLERGAYEDVAVVKSQKVLESDSSGFTVASSSLRRRAQWLAKYPKHELVSIRGNVQTRLNKFEEAENIDAAIFAKAGLERLGLLNDNVITLSWMLPAPAQGIIGIVCKEDDKVMQNVCEEINHRETSIAGFTERQFLQTLMGGCSVPISALAIVSEEKIEFEGAIHAFDGSSKFSVQRSMELSQWENAGKECAEELLQQAGMKELLEEIRNKKWNEDPAIH